MNTCPSAGRLKNISPRISALDGADHHSFYDAFLAERVGDDQRQGRQGNDRQGCWNVRCVLTLEVPHREWQRAIGWRRGEYIGKNELIPQRDRVVDGDRGKSWPGQRNEDTPENGKRSAAVEQRGFFQLTRDLAHELRENEDRNRKARRYIRADQSKGGVVQSH